MGEIAEKKYELKKAAIACGIEPDQAVDDVAEASGAAGQVASGTEEDSAEKVVRWWHAFLEDYSFRCVGRWQARCVNSSDPEAMERLWLEYFEQMWLAGCSYLKGLAVQNVRGGYDKTASRYAGRLSSEDAKKLKQYFNGVADELDKAISSIIASAKATQRQILSRTFHFNIAAEDVPESEVSNAEILDEMCKMQSYFVVTRLAQRKGLSQAEINILRYKTNPFRSGAFRVTETANEDKINKWLKHPVVNHLWPDSFVMDMAAQTPIPVVTMERILKKLLQEDYDIYWKKAEERIKSKE